MVDTKIISSGEVKTPERSWYNLDANTTLELVNTSLQEGLSNDEVQQRLLTTK